MLTGLVVLGFALENAWHYMIAALGWYAFPYAKDAFSSADCMHRGFYVFGIMITTVAITSYCLDSYPEGSGEVVRAALTHWNYSASRSLIFGLAN